MAGSLPNLSPKASSTYASIERSRCIRPVARRNALSGILIYHTNLQVNFNLYPLGPLHTFVGSYLIRIVALSEVSHCKWPSVGTYKLTHQRHVQNGTVSVPKAFCIQDDTSVLCTLEEARGLPVALVYPFERQRMIKKDGLSF